MKKSFFCSSRDGDAWAQQQFKANEMADALDTSTWTLNARCRGVALAIPVLPSDPARVLLEFVADAFEGVDAAFSKAVFKGKMLPPDQALTEIAGLKDGSKVMVIASSVAEVAAVQGSRSDPTIRGFDSADALRRSRERSLRDATDGSAWKAEQHSEYRFLRLETVAFEPARGVVPHRFDAEKLLQKLATDPGIIAIMTERRYQVGRLCEMDPQDDKLQKKQQSEEGGGAACTLGYNQNAGQRIFVRLRTDDLRGLREYRGLVNTLVHELVHNEHGPHGDAFFRLYSELKALYLRTHAKLQRQGSIVGGVSARQLADLQSGDAQNIDSALQEELTKEAANSALSDYERAAAARIAAQNQLLSSLSANMNFMANSEEAAVASELDSKKTLLSAQEAAALAAEKRLKESNPTTVMLSPTSSGGKKDDFRSPAAACVVTGGSDVSEMIMQEGCDNNDLDHPKVEDDIDNTSSKMTGIVTDKTTYDGSVSQLPRPAPPAEAVVAATAKGTAVVASREKMDEDEVPHEAQSEASSERVAGISFEEKRRQIIGMGFEPGVVERILQVHRGDMSAAITALLSSDSSSSGGSSSSSPASREERLRSAASRLIAAAHTSEMSAIAHEALLTVQVVLRNVFENPQEDKFRRLRRTNKRFARSIGRTPAAFEIIEAVGFRAVPGSVDELHLSAVDPGLLWFARELLGGTPTNG